MEAGPTSPRAFRPDVSPALEETILRAMARQPRHRHESALELREALAHPESVVLADRLSRLLRERPRPSPLRTFLTVAGGVALYAALVAVLAVVVSRL
jgi:ferric-dicitrate binding protein FerR (iron transport regulator)